MSSLVPAGTTIVFRPGPGWVWSGFDGCLRVSAGCDRMDMSGGHHCVVDTDLIRLAADLCGKGYAVVGHNVPGQVTKATIAVDDGTLFHRVVIDGRLAAKTDTTGTFRIDCRPSQFSGPPPVVDNPPVHDGTWAIEPPAHTRTEC